MIAEFKRILMPESPNDFRIDWAIGADRGSFLYPASEDWEALPYESKLTYLPHGVNVNTGTKPDLFPS